MFRNQWYFPMGHFYAAFIFVYLNMNLHQPFRQSFISTREYMSLHHELLWSFNLESETDKMPLWFATVQMGIQCEIAWISYKLEPEDLKYHAVHFIVTSLPCMLLHFQENYTGKRLVRRCQKKCLLFFIIWCQSSMTIFFRNFLESFCFNKISDCNEYP